MLGHDRPRRIRSWLYGALAVVALGSGVALFFGGTQACTLNTNDTLPDASTDSSTALHPSVCNACEIQQCAGQWAVCLQNADCIAMLACENGGGLPSSGDASADAASDVAASSSTNASGLLGCFCGGAANGRKALRALASCNEIAACAPCAAQCVGSVDAGTCADPGVPLDSDRCVTLDAGAGDGGADSGDDAGQDASTDDASADASDDGGTDASTIVDAGSDAQDGGTDAASRGACSACVAASCADAKRACGVGSECDVFIQCAGACADAACVDRCGTIHPTGKSGAAQLASCVASNCSTACGL